MSDDRARWNAKYRARDHVPAQPSAVLVELAEYLPTAGRALDLAGGAGAEAVWLAQRGLDVTVADVSDAALELCRERAAEHGVALEAVRVDLHADGPPAGPWDVVVCLNYLEPAVWPALRLAPGCTVVWIHPTVTNLQRHAKPSERFLLQPGQAADIVGSRPDLRIVVHREAWIGDRHLSVIVGRAQGNPPNRSGDVAK